MYIAIIDKKGGCEFEREQGEAYGGLKGRKEGRRDIIIL